MISIGAATLADIFDPAVRGRKVSVDLLINTDSFSTHILYSKLGIYFTVPLLGPVIFYSFYRIKYLIYTCLRLLGQYWEVY